MTADESVDKILDILRNNMDTKPGQGQILGSLQTYWIQAGLPISDLNAGIDAAIKSRAISVTGGNWVILN